MNKSFIIFLSGFYFILIFFKLNLALAFDNGIILNKIENYFKNLNTLEADFIQIGPSGNVSEGKFYLDLPGKLRFDYKKPDNILITCQGFWLIVQDRKLKQSNNVPVNQTPLNFLLNEKFDFKNELINLIVKKEDGLISLTISDLNKKDESSLKLVFSENPIQLKKWIIKDNFDNETSVLIQNLQVGIKLSYLLFFPEDFD